MQPDPDTCSDAEWSDYVFNRSGSPGIKYEWWCHIASGFWFVALRDTARDVVIATYPAEAVRRALRAGVRAAAAMMYRLEAPGRRVDRSLDGRCVSLSKAATIRDMRATPFPPRSPPRACRYLARSFKYHRPRSILSFANHDSNASVPGRRRAERARRCDAAARGHAACRPSIPSAASRATRRESWIACARCLPVGFYYKAFHSKRWFPRWERMFRALTGLGTVSLSAPRAGDPQALWILRRAGDRRRPERPRGRARGGAGRRAGSALVDEAHRLGGASVRTARPPSARFARARRTGFAAHHRASADGRGRLLCRSVGGAGRAARA